MIGGRDDHDSRSYHIFKLLLLILLSFLYECLVNHSRATIMSATPHMMIKSHLNPPKNGRAFFFRPLSPLPKIDEPMSFNEFSQNSTEIP